MASKFATFSTKALGAAFGAALTPLLAASPASAQLTVMISGGFSGSYEKLLPEFERTTGVKVVTKSGASQGNGPETVGAQIAGGAKIDVVILSREGLTELMAAGRVAPGTDVDLARTPLGIGVKAGAPKPDGGTVEGFKKIVTSAKIVAMPASTAGIWLTTQVFPKLGIADKVNVKMTPRGTGATGMVAAGEADVAVMPISEIVHAQGVELASKVAEEIQLNQVFSAAVVAGSAETANARKLIDFLTSPAAAPAINGSGMEALGKSR